MNKLLSQLKRGITVTRQVDAKGLTADEKDVYNALFVEPASDRYENIEGRFYSDTDLEDLIRVSDLTEKEIQKSLKGLLKKKIVEYDEENGELILCLVPNLM
ncbi:MAG TPA: hypothetical protein VIK55_04850 [Paludibacter sp.]